VAAAVLTSGLTSIGRRYALLGGSVRWLTGADGRQHVAEVVAGEGCRRAPCWGLLDLACAPDGVHAR
jgi:hypothetical protein